MVFGPAGNRRFLGSGRPRGPHKPFKTMGDEAPHIFEWFPGLRGRPDTEHRRFQAGPTIMPIFNCGSGPEHGYETALELVSGANFGCVLHLFSSPTRWNGSRGEVRPETAQKPNNKYNFDYLLNYSGGVVGAPAGRRRGRPSVPRSQPSLRTALGSGSLHLVAVTWLYFGRGFLIF